MKKILLFLCTLVATVTFSQNRISYNQYMHNQGVINPGFADKTTRFGGNLIFRKNWTGMANTPTTGIFHGFMNLTDAHAVSLNAYYDQQGKYSQSEIGANYAYTINLYGNSLLSFGAKINFFQESLSNTFNVVDNTDPTLANLNAVSGLNFGTGVYISGDRYYIGASAPFLFANQIAGNRGINYSAKSNHFYFTGGLKAYSSRDFVFYPTTLIKVTSGSPINASLDLNMIIQKKLWLSGGFRSDLAGIASIGILTKKGMKIIYSFESNFARSNQKFGTTHEISIGYGLSIFADKFAQRQHLRKRGGFKTRKAKRVNRFR